MICGNFQGTDIELRVPLDNENLTKKGLRAGIDHMKLNYDMILLL
jgi:hypothetical protein